MRNSTLGMLKGITGSNKEEFVRSRVHGKGAQMYTQSAVVEISGVGQFAVVEMSEKQLFSRYCFRLGLINV